MTYSELAQEYRDDAAKLATIEGLEKYVALYLKIAESIELSGRIQTDHEIYVTVKAWPGHGP